MNNPITAQLRIESPLGAATLARTAQGLAGLWFAGQKYEFGPQDASRRPPKGAQASWERPGDARPSIAAPVRPDDSLLLQAKAQLDEYWAGRRTEFDLPLDPQGTPFQRSVWLFLARIRGGGTRSYSEVAQSIGAPRAVRAVGAAIGRNPLSVILPCHRVVGRDGSLTGYAGGLDRKKALLRLEGARGRLNP